MPLVQEHGITFVHWSERADLKVWKELSAHIIDQFGKGPFTAQKDVEPILFAAHAWALEQFRYETAKERSSAFYKAVVGIYENSVSLKQYTDNGIGYQYMSMQDFAVHRSALRLIIERACELDLDRVDDKAVFSLRQIELLEELLVLGKWAFTFSEVITMLRLMNGEYEVHFDDASSMKLIEPKRFSQLVKHMRDELFRLMPASIVDSTGFLDLKSSLWDCLGVDYDKNDGLVLAYKTMHPSGFPIIQDVKYDELVERFAERSGFRLAGAKTFYAGLTLSVTSKESLENIVYKPHSNRRYMNRPLLNWTINGENRAVVGPQKWTESLILMVTNAIQWAAISDEWLANDCIRLFSLRKGDEHDKLLEDPAEEVLKNHQVKYSRNVTRLRSAKGGGTSVNQAGLGEIDFLYLDEIAKELCVVDCKYHRRHSNMVGFSGDYSTFVKKYEPKLERKVAWYRDNLRLVEDHFKLEYPDSAIDLGTYKVRGFFIVNTPTYYSFNGTYRAYTIQEFRELMDRTLEDAVFFIEDADGSMSIIQRPYFRKLIEINFNGIDLDEQ